MSQSIGYVALVVRDYDEAIRFYVDTLGFELIEDTFIESQNKHWVLVAPPGSTGTRLLLATAALTASFALWAFRSQGLERIAASFIVAGALANVIDRAVYGVVTDYLDLHFGAWHPFVFNLADVWITAGAISLFFCQFSQKQSRVALRG